MNEVNPYDYESSGTIPIDPTSNWLPVNFVFTAMVGVVATLLAGFLVVSGVFYGFRWPGPSKSAISFAIFLVCVAYGMVRQSKEMKLLRGLSFRGARVGLIHICIVLAFGFAVFGFAHWVTKNTSI